MKTKCMIIDDEPLAIEVIETYLQKLNEMDVVAKCRNSIEAFELLQKKNADLIFLDIEMPELSGLDFLKSLKNPPKIIFTTAHRKYALDGFELDVIDFLLKPISFERFLKAVQKFYKTVEPELKVMHGQHGQEDDFIYVKENKKVVKIHFSDIHFIESLKDYIIIHSSSKNVITKISITKLEEQLPATKFLRIHRSFIVAIPKIDAFTSRSVHIGKKELTIGRTYKNIVLKTLDYSKI